MYVRRLFPIIIITALLLISCSGSKKANADDFVINGILYNAKESTIYLEELTIKDRVILDSAKIDRKGSFFFRFKPAQIGFYVLKLDENNFITLLIDKGETVNVSGDARQLAQTYDVKGSDGSEKIHQINVKLASNYQRVDSLKNVFEENQYKENFLEIKQLLDSVYAAIFLDQKHYIETFIDSNLTSLASIIALYQMFGQQPLMSEKDDFLWFEKLSESLIKKYPANPHSQDLYLKVTEIKKFLKQKEEAAARLAIGNMAPDIQLNDTQGNTVALSSLKGQVVLLDFWASWCAPCRELNPQLKKLYGKFASKGFQIYAVSFDRDKQSWIKAVEMDKMNWITVSDLMYWNSPIAKLYDVEEIPANFLIDKNGAIVGRNLPLEEVEKYLLTYLK
ncbi:MAG: Thiol-disulfide oxidoreductase ResA [Bacteroidetes bacterium ADurb.Bin408]|nr:MAG: Thiol-disulfide oxidoreductase ResA [Bacteroidetes bacterium ADurb.Bin408]